MGTLSKRGLKEFGIDVNDRIQDFRTNVGKKLDGIGAEPDEGKAQGAFSRRLERLTSALPKTTWLALAGASIVSAIALKVAKRHTSANFAAVWVPTFLVLGLFSKSKTLKSPRSAGFIDRADLH